MNTQLRVFNILATVIAVSAGLMVLAAYFVQLDILVAVRLALVSFVYARRSQRGVQRHHQRSGTRDERV